MATDKRQSGPPDGGWGWVVCFGTLLNSMYISLPGMAFGIMLDDMLRIYNTTTYSASGTISIVYAVANFISPLVSISINRLSCRKTAIFGGLVMSGGLMLSAFTTNIQMLYLTFGICSGIGYGCTQVATMCVNSQYFKLRYGIAIGISLIGYSLGRLVFSPIFLIIKDNYGFNGTMLILGAVCMNICVGAALFQPVKWHCIPLPADDVVEINKIKSTMCDVKIEFISTVQHEFKNDESETKTITLKDEISSTKPDNWRTMLANSLDFTLLRQKLFYFSASATILCHLVCNNSTVFLIPLGLDKGFQPMDVVMVLSIKSVAEIVGRATMPWLLHVTRANTIPTHVTTSVITASIFLLIVKATDYYVFTILWILNSILFSSLLIQNYHFTLMFIGPTKYSSAIGLIALMQGSFTIVLGPILGYMRDVTGSLTTAYVLLAAIQFLHAALWFMKYLTSYGKLLQQANSDINNR